MKLCCLAFVLLALLCGCGSRNTPNTIRIANSGASPLRLSGDGLYVNPGLLGIEDSTAIDIHTSADNEITFDVSRQAQPVEERQGRAF